MNIESELKTVKLPSKYRRNGKECYFDSYRKKLIEITPEETVRQKIATLFEQQYGVPKEMLLLEVPMSYYVSGISGRADIVIHATDDNGQTMYPVAVVECKNEDILLTDKVADQAIRYCDTVGGKYIILTNGVDLLFAAYDEKSDCYVYLDEILTYERMVNKTYFLPKVIETPFERFTLKELNNQDKLSNYNELGPWIFGEGTGRDLRPFVVNMYQCLLDVEHRLPQISKKTFSLIEDIGLRFVDYSNAGGGHYCGEYRSFLVRDRFKEPQIISISLFGTDTEFRGEHRNSYTSLVVAIDHFKTSHNSLQYNIDRFANIRPDGIIEFFHNGQISSHKSIDVTNKIGKNGCGLTVCTSGIFLGRIRTDKVFYLDDKEISDFIYNLIEYALLREEVRRESHQMKNNGS